LKKLEAYVRKEKFSEIDEELKRAKVGGLTFIIAEGRGRSEGEKLSPGRGTKPYTPEYIDRLKLEVIVKDMDVKKVVDAIIKTASTHSTGDGKVFLSPVEQIFDIGSGETGDKAI
jgi:nitrogen regulatory protein PII